MHAGAPDNFRQSVLYQPGASRCAPAPPVDCTSGSIQFTSELIAATDIATNPPAPTIQLCRSIPIDFSRICAETLPGGNLSLTFLAGQINYQEIGGVVVQVGGTELNPLDGDTVYSDTADPTGGFWVSLLPVPRTPFVFRANFNNPNPAGTSWVKICATPGSGAFAGIRNYQLQIKVI